MDKDKLTEMAKNPNLVPGIYNYCDRWCERCAFTSRCLQYQMEQEEIKENGLKSHDMENEQFWDKISESFDLVRELLEDWLDKDELEFDPAQEQSDFDEFMEKQEEKDKKVQEHHCTRIAMSYRDLVDDWFDHAEDIWDEKEGELKLVQRLDIQGRDPEKEATELIGIAEVIRYYQHFISVKIRRALNGLFDDPIPILEDMPKDHDGSAKIALIAIDRSIGAWTTFYKTFPQKEDQTLKVLVVLEKLRRHLEETLPNARDFVRPGFDES